MSYLKNRYLNDDDYEDDRFKRPSTAVGSSRLQATPISTRSTNNPPKNVERVSEIGFFLLLNILL